MFQSAAVLSAMVDRRPQSSKARISWHPAWLGERDRQGGVVGDWAEPVDSKTFRCNWCKKVRVNYKSS